MLGASLPCVRTFHYAWTNAATPPSGSRGILRHPRGPPLPKAPPPTAVVRTSLLIFALLLLVAIVALAWASERPAHAALPELPQVSTAPPTAPETQPATPAAIAPPTPQARVRLQVAIETVARLLPPRTTPRVVLAAGETHIVGELVAGVGASPLATRPEGRQLVRFPLPGGAECYRVVRLDRAVEGPLELELGTSISPSGKVVGSDGKPLSGARVWLAGVSTTTGPDGSFKLESVPVPAAGGLPFAVYKPGFAARFRILDARRCRELGRSPIPLGPGAELRVRFLGVGQASTSAGAPRFYLLPEAGRDSRLLEFPFFLPGCGVVTPGDDGVARFPSVPQGVEVRVLGEHPECAPVVSEPLRVRAGTQLLALHGELCRTIQGRVKVGDGGSAQPVWACLQLGQVHPRVNDRGFLLPAGAMHRDVVVREADAHGVFSLPRPNSAPSELHLIADGHLGVALGIRDGVLPLDPVPLLPATDLSAATLVLRARGPRAATTVAEAVLWVDGAERGRYPWAMGEDLTIPLGHPGLCRVTVHVEGRDPIAAVRVASGRVPLEVPLQ